eukprot:COSAG06_NODE_47802_length_338_cov_5.054852_2_plen_56_part_01
MIDEHRIDSLIDEHRIDSHESELVEIAGANRDRWRSEGEKHGLNADVNRPTLCTAE